MWATLPRPLPNPTVRREAQRGFTIVELLIVIVVIGILAAITIVAYNGVQQRAVVASIQSDLEGSAKQLAIDLVTNGTYPATTAAANGGQGLKASSNNSYSYTVNTAANPQTFCIAETNGSNIYSVTSTNNTPATGGCVITNLMPNPSLRAGTTGWSVVSSGGSPAGSLLTGLTDVPVSGITTAYRMTLGGMSSSWWRAQYLNIPVVAGQVYNVSGWVRTSNAGNDAAGLLQWKDSFGSGLSQSFAGTSPVVNTWTQLALTATAPAGAVMAWVQFGPTNSGATGATFDVTAVMFTTGTSSYKYADGNSAGWVWNGTANTSTSTGQQL
jgi:prepilin-type N-terminal cleavage/methylation domain-containing protein